MTYDDEPDLFDNYPDQPGWKEGDTSRAAAEAMVLRASNLRRDVFSFIRKHPHHTADEIAQALGESILSIRPRVSELRRMGLIDSDGKGRNKSGATAHQWKAAS